MLAIHMTTGAAGIFDYQFLIKCRPLLILFRLTFQRPGKIGAEKWSLLLGGVQVSTQQLCQTCITKSTHTCWTCFLTPALSAELHDVNRSTQTYITLCNIDHNHLCSAAILSRSVCTHKSHWWPQARVDYTITIIAPACQSLHVSLDPPAGSF